VDQVEALEFERAKFWVRVLGYPKGKLPAQPELGIVQGQREVSLIPGGSFGVGITREVLFSKFTLHVPLYRRQDPLA
jgi:transposase